MTETKSKKELVINMDTFGIPIAILLSALVIAVLVFFASKNPGKKDDSVVQGDTSNTAIVEGKVSLGDDPYLGNLETAKVAIVEFSDYQCGYCQRHSEQTFPTIKENYIDTGKVVYVFKEFPLSGVGQMGYTIAEGGACVFNLSGSVVYAEYHKEAFFTESESALFTLVESLGVNSGDFKSCLEEGKYRDEISADQKEGQGAGISGTPGFVVGIIGEDGIVDGKLISGAYPYDTFASAIEELLK